MEQPFGSRNLLLSGQTAAAPLSVFAKVVGGHRDAVPPSPETRLLGISESRRFLRELMLLFLLAVPTPSVTPSKASFSLKKCLQLILRPRP